MSTTRLLLLGTPHAERDGAAIPLSNSKGLALLAFLAAHPAPQPRERLLDLLWPDSLPDAARKNLRNTLWLLRRDLGEGALHSDNERLFLEPSLWVDSAHLARPLPDTASAAEVDARLSLYRGPLLDGVALNDAPDMELWLAAERERSGQQLLRLLERRLAMWRSAGAWREVVTLAHRALAHDPLQEPISRLLMEAHAQLGERAEALRHYDSLRTLLADELGVPPLPETEALRAAILAGQPTTAAPAAPAAPAALPRRVATAPPFVGRRDEWAALDALAAEAEQGQGRAALLVGELGIGKTTLWQAWQAARPSVWLTLEAICLEVTQPLPLAPLTELWGRDERLRALLRPDSPLAPLWRMELARLLPELCPAQAERPPPLPPSEERHRLFEALVQSLLALPPQPLLLWLDDLHWADPTTLEWLGYALHRLADHPLLLVGSFRAEDAPPALTRLVAGWQRAALARRIPLPRLSLAESSALVERLGGNPALVGHLQHQSAGNPLFLIELCRADNGAVPPVLTALLRARLAPLSAGARQVLQAAAILGPPFAFGALRRTSGRSEEEALDALDELLGQTVLSEADGRYSFAHPLVGEVVRDDMSAARRHFLHRRAAESLAASSRGEPPWARLAAHWAAAGEPTRAAEAADRAAQAALGLGALGEALVQLRQAHRWEPTAARALALGRALVLHGELAEGQAAMHEALAAFERADQPSAAARSALALAESFLPLSQPDQVRRWVERGLRDVTVHTEPEIHALAHFHLGAATLQGGGDLSEAEHHLHAAAALASEHGLADVAARARFEEGNLLAERGALAEAVAAFEHSVLLAAGSLFQTVLGLNNAAYHATLLGELPRARQHIERALTLADEQALLLPYQYLYSTRGELALAEGAWDEAEAWFLRGLAEAERHGNLLQRAGYLANLGLAARGRGEATLALARLEAARAALGGQVAPHFAPQLDLWLAESLLAAGQPAAAHSALARAEAQLAGGERQQLASQAATLRRTLEHAQRGLRLNKG